MIHTELQSAKYIPKLPSARFSYRRSPKSAVFIAPYSWEWAALKLAEGAVAWVEGKLIANILGEPKTEDLIADAVAELKHYISNILEEREVRSCQERVNAVVRNLRAYELAPTSSEHRLNDADLESSRLMEQLGPKGWNAIGPYVHAVSLRLLTLRIRATHFKSRDELAVLIETVDEVLPRVRGMVDYSSACLDYENDPNYDPSIRTEYYDERYVDDTGRHGTRWWEAGYAQFSCPDAESWPVHWERNFETEEDAIRIMTEKREAYLAGLRAQYQRMDEKVYAPLQEITDRWSNAGRQAKVDRDRP